MAGRVRRRPGAAEGGQALPCGGRPPRPGLHSRRFRFSQFLRRKHRPVTSMCIARMARPPTSGDLIPPAPPCLPARGKVGKGIWAEDGVLAKPGGALGPPRGHPNRGMEPGREPDFSGPGTLAVRHPPPIPGSPGNAAVAQQQLVYFQICVPQMPSLHLSGVVRRGPHHRCLQVGPRR